MRKQAEAFAPACALTMDEVFHGSVRVLQLAKSLHRQQRKSHRADQKRQHKEDNAVFYRVGNHHGESQQGEQSACQLEHEARAGRSPAHSQTNRDRISDSGTRIIFRIDI